MEFQQPLKPNENTKIQLPCKFSEFSRVSCWNKIKLKGNNPSKLKMSKYLQKPSTVRPKAAVEKALQQHRAASANAVGTGSTVETSEDEKLDQIFFQNYEIAKALLPVVPFRRE